MLKELTGLLEFHKKHGIVTESYGGQSPVFRSKGTALDPVLSSIAKRLSESSGKKVEEGHVLMLWQKAKGIVFVTYVRSPRRSIRMPTNVVSYVIRTTTKEARMYEYIAAAEVSGLTPEDVKAIDEAGMKEVHRHFVRSQAYSQTCALY